MTHHTDTTRLQLYVANLDCDHDAATLRRGLVGTHGVVHVEIRPQAGEGSDHHRLGVTQRC